MSEPAPSALDGMTKAQLLDYAAKNGVEGVSSAMTKADILAALKEGEEDA